VEIVRANFEAWNADDMRLVVYGNAENALDFAN
jgi:hypothetical protein